MSTVQFNQSAYSTDESDGTVDVTLYHGNPSSTAMKITIKSNSVSTASKWQLIATVIVYYTFVFTYVGSDYNQGPYIVIIPSGENDVTFSVSITDDNIREESETFDLIIDESSLPNGVASGNLNKTTVTIMDRDSE